MTESKTGTLGKVENDVLYFKSCSFGSIFSFCWFILFSIFVISKN